MADHAFHLLATVENEQGTALVARRLAEAAPMGAVLILSGTLGAGKTTFMKFFAQALGIDPHAVHSPTFTLVHEHRKAMVPLIHMDVYRLEDKEAFDHMGGWEYIDDNPGIVAIEWGESLLDELPPIWVQLRFDAKPGSPRRQIWARSGGPKGTEWLQRAATLLGSDHVV